MELLKVIKNRRTIRKYKPDFIEKEKIMKIVEGVRWAPSWGNTQCWELIIVKAVKTKRMLSKTLPKNNPARDAVSSAPVVIAVCGKKELSGYIGGRLIPDKKSSWLMFDLGLAMQNLTLMAHDLGLGTVHVGWFNSKKAKEILKVPENVDLVELIPLGYPAEFPKRATRKKIKSFLYLDRHGLSLKRWTRTGIKNT